MKLRLPANWRPPEVRIVAPLAVLLGLAWGLIALTDEVREGEFGGFDHAILLAMRGADLSPGGPSWLAQAARDLTALGGATVLTLTTLVAVLALLALGRRTQAAIFGAAVVLAQAGVDLAKMVIDRPRPDLVPHGDIVYSASFPSGHAAMTPVVYLTLAAMLAAGSPRPLVKLLAFTTAGLLTIIVGLSRVYLGVHWPTDVLAGWTFGAGMALAATIVLYRTAPKAGAAAVGPDNT